MKVFDEYPTSDGYSKQNDVVSVGQKTLDLANFSKGYRIDVNSPIYKKLAAEISESSTNAIQVSGGYMSGRDSEMLRASLNLLRAFESNDEAEIKIAIDDFYVAAHSASPLKDI